MKITEGIHLLILYCFLWSLSGLIWDNWYHSKLVFVHWPYFSETLLKLLRLVITHPCPNCHHQIAFPKLNIKHEYPLLYKSLTLFIYLSIYFQFIYRWQILFHRTIRLAFHKQQGLSQTSGAINNIVECCYRWHQIFETEPQFVVLIKVNTNQNRNAKIRQYAPNWQMTLYQNDLIKTLKIIVNASAEYIWKYL